MMITGLEDPVKIYDVMLLLIDDVTISSPVCGDGLGEDDGCDLVIVGGDCDGGREEVVDMMITELEDPAEIYDVMLLLIDNVTVNSSPVCGDALGVDDGCDLVIVGGACDGEREEVEDTMITELEDPVKIYDVMLLLIDNVTVNSSPVCGDALGEDDGCDLVIVGGDCDGGREEAVKLQNMLVHWQRLRGISVYGMMAVLVGSRLAWRKRGREAGEGGREEERGRKRTSWTIDHFL